jgi:hypothetical protein
MLMFMVIFTWVLFYALSPGILLKIPAGGSPRTVAAVHGLVFALIYGFTHKMVWAYFYN